MKGWLKKFVPTLARAIEVARVKKAFGCEVEINSHADGYVVWWLPPNL